MTDGQTVRLKRLAECFVIENGAAMALAYVYFEDEAGRRTQTGRMTEADALQVARIIARALDEALRKMPSKGVEEADQRHSS